MDFHTSLTCHGDRALLAVRGELDAIASLQLRWRANDAHAAGCHHISVDLTNLTFIDAAGIGALVRLRRTAQLDGGSVTLVGAGAPLRRACQLSGLPASFFDPMPTVQTA